MCTYVAFSIQRPSLKPPLMYIIWYKNACVNNCESTYTAMTLPNFNFPGNCFLSSVRLALRAIGMCCLLILLSCNNFIRLFKRSFKDLGGNMTLTVA